MKISTRLKKLATGKKKEISFRQLLNKFHQKDNFFIIILLAIPPATPLSFIPGFSALFGFMIAVISLQLLASRKKIWLPSKLSEKKVPPQINEGILKIIPCIEFLEKYIKNRAKFLTSPFIRPFFVIFIFILSLLLMLPIPYVDFFSSSAIIMISMGIIQKDGLLIIVAFILSLIYLLILFYLLRAALFLIYKAYNYIKSLF
ncbi:exopolysaccharide biosynthesis protein [Legionella sp. PC997]|uniref:exopolysaccharide biosynthesis protein n=1 Tax=Legionella sp. PC997 TaxID=2755562 RepID=UPI0015F8FDA4|nr:exopolysaccharide biosynthesis protein [Legionella sp. PC997]QMT59809.1 sugar transporter [Legionella sp. PC997]